MNKISRIEPQYAPMKRAQSYEPLGMSVGYAWQDDPKRLVFTASRYKFVAKMLHGKGRVLEVGCGDAFFTRIVCQEVAYLTAVDIDPAFVGDVHRRMLEMPSHLRFECRQHDMVEAPLFTGPYGHFDAAFSLDVLEHIEPAQEKQFVQNVAKSIDEQGVAIFGMPSLVSQKLASKLSKEGHVNCKDGPALKTLLAEFFHNVFMFSMNDEVVHTGHHAMAHYLLAVCAGRR